MENLNTWPLLPLFNIDSLVIEATWKMEFRNVEEKQIGTIPKVFTY